MVEKTERARERGIEKDIYYMYRDRKREREREMERGFFTIGLSICFIDAVFDMSDSWLDSQPVFQARKTETSSLMCVGAVKDY